MNAYLCTPAYHVCNLNWLPWLTLSWVLYSQECRIGYFCVEMNI